MALMRRKKRPGKRADAESAGNPVGNPTDNPADNPADKPVGTSESPESAESVESAGTAPVNWEERYTAEHKAFEAYKADIFAADIRRRKEDAYRNILREAGIPERKRDAVMRLADLDALALTDSGEIADAEEVCAGIREEWREIIPVLRETGADVAYPPMSRSRGLTKDSIMAIRDRGERRAAILENMELFR